MWEVRHPITSIRSRSIFDSRGNPTVEADLTLSDKFFGRASVPSGASVGAREIVELRDNEHAYHGKGVQKALEIIQNVIAPKLIGVKFSRQEELDEFLMELNTHGGAYGGNTILAISLAFAKAAANALSIPLYKFIGEGTTLPTPFVNLINGGAHSNNQLFIQEFMIVPHGFEEFTEKLRAASEIFHNLKLIMQHQNINTAVGDEGGFGGNIGNVTDAIEYILEAIIKSGYRIGEQVSLALDVAASEFYIQNHYMMQGKEKDTTEMINYYIKLIKDYPIISIEDPMAESDYEGWQSFTREFKDKIQIVGDDIFVTNQQLLKEGIEKGIANSILIKPNQVGTLTHALRAIELAKASGYKIIISHRSGETEDTTIAHLAVGTGAGQIKTGSICRGERTAKYNELLRIQEQF